MNCMQLLVVTLEDTEVFLRMLNKLSINFRQGIVVPTTSLKHALLHSEIDAAPIFGSLTKLVENNYEPNNTLFLLLTEEEVEQAKETVRKITEGIEKKGIMFTVPISSMEVLK